MGLNLSFLKPHCEIMVLPIVMYGSRVLIERAEVIEFGSDIKELIRDMFETMDNADGVGLAAPQIGKGIRVFVTDASYIDSEIKDFRRVFINPEIIVLSEEEGSYEEGCLSIPHIHLKVKRPVSLRMRCFDENWEEHDLELDGLRARIVLHEYDHIEGKLFVDYLPRLRKRMIRAKLQNILKKKIDVKYPITHQQ